ncbi:hypothetical protein GCM10027203_10130 [Nonomuraea fastidiosa]
MSNTDRPQVPRTPDRGAWPDPSSRRRDLARSATDGWPSVAEWREQRARQRAHETPSAEKEPAPPANPAENPPESPAARVLTGDAPNPATGSRKKDTSATADSAQPEFVQAESVQAEFAQALSVQAVPQPSADGTRRRAEAEPPADVPESSADEDWRGARGDDRRGARGDGQPGLYGEDWRASLGGDWRDSRDADRRGSHTAGIPPEPPSKAPHPFFQHSEGPNFTTAQDGDEVRPERSQQRRPADEWHSEVLAGPSWFAPVPDEGDSRRRGRARRGGGSGSASGDRSSRFGTPSAEPPAGGRSRKGRSRPPTDPGRIDAEPAPFGGESGRPDEGRDSSDGAHHSVGGAAGSGDEERDSLAGTIGPLHGEHEPGGGGRAQLGGEPDWPGEGRGSSRGKRDSSGGGRRSSGEERGSFGDGRASSSGERGSFSAESGLFGEGSESSRQDTGSFGGGAGASRQGTGLFGGGAEVSGEGTGPFGGDAGPFGRDTGSFGDGAGASVQETGVFGGGAGAFEEDAGPFGEGDGSFREGAVRRGRKGGRYGRKSRGSGTQDRGWSPDGSDDDSGAGPGFRRQGRRRGWSPEGADDDGQVGSGQRRGWSPKGSDADGGAGSGERRRGRRRGWLPDGPDDDSPAGTGPHADPEAVARAICLRLLTIAPKTRAQLADALRKRDVPEEAAEAVLSRFSELGLINDEAFAAAWVDSRHHGRGLAKRALAAELRQRGVDSETVSEAVERLDPEQEVETARRLVERKLASTRSLDPQKRTRRLAGMLARKGYPSGLAYRVIREALEQEGIEMDEEFPS